MTDDTAYILDDQIGYLLRLANQRHSVIFQNLMTHELTPTQFATLIRVAEAGKVSQNQLGRMAAMDIATIKGVVDRLKAKGLLETSPDLQDRRRSLISLTGAGADLIDDLRMVKSDYELARIAYVCARLTEIHDDMMAGTKPGETMAAFNSKHIGALMKRVLADNPAINMTATKVHGIFQAAEVTHDPHNFTDLGLKTAEGGPMITLVNGVIDGYGGEIERTFFLGHAPEACKRPFDVMLEARQAALDAARPGALMSDVDRAANEVFIRAGYAENLLHRAGHGIGVTGHEAPFFAEGYDREILPGMVFTMEPGVYIEGVGGFRQIDIEEVDAGVTLSWGATTVLLLDAVRADISRADVDIA